MNRREFIAVGAGAVVAAAVPTPAADRFTPEDLLAIKEACIEIKQRYADIAFYSDGLGNSNICFHCGRSLPSPGFCKERCVKEEVTGDALRSE